MMLKKKERRAHSKYDDDKSIHMILRVCHVLYMSYLLRKKNKSWFIKLYNNIQFNILLLFF